MNPAMNPRDKVLCVNNKIEKFRKPYKTENSEQNTCQELKTAKYCSSIY